MELRTLEGGHVTVAEAAVEALAGTLAGDLVRPADGGYETARALWNGMVDRRPGLIARCANAGDVAAAVRVAGEHDLLVAVRGGGHGVAGNASCDGGLVIDLTPMRGVEVDAERRLVRAEGGCRLGDVDRATHPHGLAVPFGVVSQTGIAGLTLSGGMGWLRRRHGLTSDNLVSAQVVTADGSTMTASEDEHAELFWGLRGGGGNFGVVTAFEYRAHPISPDVAFVFVLYPGERARDVLDGFAAYMREAADDVSPIAIVGRVPANEHFPEAAHRRPMAAVAGVHPGPPEEGERVLRPLRELAEPIADLSGVLPYPEAQTLLDEDYPDGALYYWKSLELEELTDEVVELVLRHAESAPSDASTIDVWWHGGALARLAAGDTAFGPRPLILLGYEANFDDAATADANVAWVRDAIDELRPHSTGGAYLNFPGFFEEGDELLRASYGDANYERLVALKTAVDPANRFRLNGNIRPS